MTEPETEYIITEELLVKLKDAPLQEQADDFAEIVRKRKYTSASKVLDLIEAIIEDRIIELKRWSRLAKRNEDRKRELEILPVMGENQAMLARVKELRQQEREQG